MYIRLCFSQVVENIRKDFQLTVYKTDRIRKRSENQCLCERHFGVNRQTIAGWLGQSEAIQTSKYKRKSHTVVSRNAKNENEITQPLRENLNPQIFVQPLIPSLMTS